MNPFSMLTRRWSKSRRKGYVRIDSDAPLNYHPDQEKNIRKELLEIEALRAVEMIKTSASVALFGGSLAMFVLKRYRMGSLLALAFLVQKALSTPRQPQALDVERYALKAERGDYGHLEVIPFR